MISLRCMISTAFAVAVAVTPGMTGSSAAIDAQPTDAQIRAALAKGKEAAAAHRLPETFYTRFGADDELHPGGFLITKLEGVSILSAHMALRGTEPSASDVAQVIMAPTLLVSAVIFGETPSFAVNSYMVLDQGGTLIKPVTLRVDGQAHRSGTGPKTPRFAAKVVALFNYADFDPAAKTTIIVFPSGGGEARFFLDFASVQ